MGSVGECKDQRDQNDDDETETHNPHWNQEESTSG